MSKAMFDFMTDFIKGKMAKGEKFDDIVARYPKLTTAEINQLRKACGA
mgnify:CR=1 FL=1